MSHSFAPLTAAQAAALSQATGVDFTRTDFTSDQWLCVSRETEFICVFEMQQPWDAHISVMCRDRRAVTRRMLRAAFTAVFSRAKRVTAFIEPANGHTHNLAAKLGFTPEGFVRLGIAGERDAIMLGMLKSECPWLRKPSPRFPVADAAGMDRVDPKAGGDLRVCSSRDPDLSHLRDGQLMHGVLLPARRHVMSDGVGHVVAVRRPAQVLGVDAGAIAAAMRHFVTGWAGTMHRHAHKAVRQLRAGIAVPHLPVAPVLRERPFETPIVIKEDGGIQKCLSLAVGRAASCGGAMLLPAVEMFAAKTSRPTRVVTSINRAGWRI